MSKACLQLNQRRFHIGRLKQNMEQDHSWEYDAPSHVVDFKDLDGADTSDHWFGESNVFTYLT